LCSNYTKSSLSLLRERDNENTKRQTDKKQMREEDFLFSFPIRLETRFDRANNDNDDNNDARACVIKKMNF